MYIRVYKSSYYPFIDSDTIFLVCIEVLVEILLVICISMVCCQHERNLICKRECVRCVTKPLKIARC